MNLEFGRSVSRLAHASTHAPKASRDLSSRRLITEMDQAELKEHIMKLRDGVMRSRTPIETSRFRLVRCLGAGGIADVFCAEEINTGTKIAIKILQRRIKRHEGIERAFAIEGEILERLDHPNIIKGVYASALGSDDGIRPNIRDVIAMEYVAEIHRYYYSMYHNAVLKTIYDALDPLGYLHGKGYLHRDLCTSNLMLASAPRSHPQYQPLSSDDELLSGGEFEVLLADFNLSLRTRFPGGSAQDHALTNEGLIPGKAEYLAPEQVAVSNTPGKEIDHRADLYSMAVIFHDLLTGRLPFEIAGDSNDPILLRALYAQILSKDPVRPSRQKRQNPCNPHIPSDLDDLVLKGLQKRPEDRYQSAAEFRAAIEVFLKKHPEYNSYSPADFENG